MRGLGWMVVVLLGVGCTCSSGPEPTPRQGDAAERGVTPVTSAAVVRLRRDGASWRASFVATSGEVTREVTFDSATPLPLRLAIVQVVSRGDTVQVEPDDDVNYTAIVAVLDALRAEGVRFCLAGRCEDPP